MAYLFAAALLAAVCLAVKTWELADENKSVHATNKKLLFKIENASARIEDLNGRVDERDAVIRRQVNVIAAKNKEIERTGVYRGTDGRLHSLGSVQS